MYGLTYSTNSRISSQQTRTARRGSPAHAAPASCQLRLALRAHSKHAQGADMDQSCVGVRHRRDRRPRDLHPPGSLQLHAASPPPPTLCEAPSVLRTELTSEDAMPACLTGFTALRASSLKSGKVWSPSLSAPRQPGIPAYPAAIQCADRRHVSSPTDPCYPYFHLHIHPRASSTRLLGHTAWLRRGPGEGLMAQPCRGGMTSVRPPITSAPHCAVLQSHFIAAGPAYLDET